MEPINRCEMITCECGGKFQRRALNKHARTKMHIDYFNLRLRREAEETIMYVNLKRTPSEEDREVWQQEIEDIKEQELRDNNAEVEAWKAEEEEEENARLADIPKKKLESSLDSRGGNFGRFRTVYSWERPYHQPGFRD